MKLNFVVKVLFICITGLACFGQAQQTVKKVAAKPTVSVAGKDLFRQYCAVCHGTDGKGAGPAAAALKSSPPDLTQISRRNEGRFPEERMMRMLTGQETVTAHGSQDMPVWGNVFNNMSNNLEMTQARLHGLMQYIEDMQAK
jgi:mono/diheme cytochrome c family protein